MVLYYDWIAPKATLRKTPSLVSFLPLELFLYEECEDYGFTDESVTCVVRLEIIVLVMSLRIMLLFLKYCKVDNIFIFLSMRLELKISEAYNYT
jgi:hypothetical protein